MSCSGLCRHTLLISRVHNDSCSNQSDRCPHSIAVLTCINRVSAHFHLCSTRRAYRAAASPESRSKPPLIFLAPYVALLAVLVLLLLGDPRFIVIEVFNCGPLDAGEVVAGSETPVKVTPAGGLLAASSCCCCSWSAATFRSVTREDRSGTGCGDEPCEQSWGTSRTRRIEGVCDSFKPPCVDPSLAAFGLLGPTEMGRSALLRSVKDLCREATGAIGGLSCVSVKRARDLQDTCKSKLSSRGEGNLAA